MTDGLICDQDKTIDAIVEASYSPMSIIIIGVGNEDFSAMDLLDCDNGFLRGSTREACRDIVQFVPFRQFGSDMNSLAQAVLKEIPGQISKYHTVMGIEPKF